MWQVTQPTVHYTHLTTTLPQIIGEARLVEAPAIRNPPLLHPPPLQFIVLLPFLEGEKSNVHWSSPLSSFPLLSNTLFFGVTHWFSLLPPSSPPHCSSSLLPSSPTLCSSWPDSFICAMTCAYVTWRIDTWHGSYAQVTHWYHTWFEKIWRIHTHRQACTHTHTYPNTHVHADTNTYTHNPMKSCVRRTRTHTHTHSGHFFWGATFFLSLPPKNGELTLQAPRTSRLPDC